jgi:hypothetical protein
LRKRKRTSFAAGGNTKTSSIIPPGVSKEDLPLRAYRAFVDQILAPLHKVFAFHQDNVRVLYDLYLQHLTVFNHAGHVYLNIGQQHYENGGINDLESALLSWYHTLAHEFAVISRFIGALPFS